MGSLRTLKKSKEEIPPSHEEEDFPPTDETDKEAKRNNLLVTFAFLNRQLVSDQREARRCLWFACVIFGLYMCMVGLALFNPSHWFFISLTSVSGLITLYALILMNRARKPLLRTIKVTRAKIQATDERLEGLV